MAVAIAVAAAGALQYTPNFAAVWNSFSAPDAWAERLAAGLNERDALLVVQMNWQLENVLLYTGRHVRPDLAWVRLGDVMPHWPFLVEDNHRLGRDVVVTADAAADVLSAYGPAFPLIEEQSVPVVALPDAAAQVPRGMPYVLAVLTPPPERSVDPEAMDEALVQLTGGRVPARRAAAYELFAGLAGDPPQIYRASATPFTERFRILDEPFTVRIDSWRSSDTFRRPGFGHVLRQRDHILIVERGVNLVWLRRDGTPSLPYYAASLFALQPRYRIPRATLQLASSAPKPEY